MSQTAIRTVLKSQPDGMTITALAQKIGADRANIARMLPAMKDVYIDRWTEASRGVSKYTPIYMLVEIPDDAPMPE